MEAKLAEIDALVANFAVLVVLQLGSQLQGPKVTLRF